MHVCMYVLSNAFPKRSIDIPGSGDDVPGTVRRSADRVRHPADEREALGYWVGAVFGGSGDGGKIVFVCVDRCGCVLFTAFLGGKVGKRVPRKWYRIRTMSFSSRWGYRSLSLENGGAPKGETRRSLRDPRYLLSSC